MQTAGFTLAPESVSPVRGPEGSRRRGRIEGIDVARGIAMAAMTITHFVAWREGDGLPYAAAEVFRGRAMPLFMLLGGVGVTLMVRRSESPARTLLLRSVMLMALGLFLTDQVDRLAIVLQSYSLLFVLAMLMVSRIRFPKAVKRESKLINAFQVINIVLIIYCGVTRTWPEYLFGIGVFLLVAGIIAGRISKPVVTAEQE